MNADPKPADSAHDASEVRHPSVACRGDTGSVAEMLKSRLLPEARGRMIRRAVAGGRFCAVMLDDGGVGVANLCPHVCGEPSRQVSDWLPRPATPATDALAALVVPERSAVGLATANALANCFAGGSHQPNCTGLRHGVRRGQASIEGDLLDVLELHPDDHLGMVGCFSPLVEQIRQRVRRLSIFEKGRRLTPDLLPEDRAADVLPECSVALITSTAIMNGTIDALLVAAAHCREVVLLGPSTPLVPEAFAESPRRASLLAGVVVTDPEGLLRIVARDGGTRDFRSCVAKVIATVNSAADEIPPSPTSLRSDIAQQDRHRSS